MIKYQKVIKVGNSLAVTLDNEFVAQTGIAAGQSVAAVYKPEKKSVSLTAANEAENLIKEEKQAYLAGQITPEFRDWVEKSLEEDSEAMTKLSNL